MDNFGNDLVMAFYILMAACATIAAAVAILASVLFVRFVLGWN